MKLTRIALRNIGRNKRRSVLSGIAIAISVFAIVAMYSFSGGMINDMKRNIFTYVTGHVKVRNSEYEKFETSFPLHLGIENYGTLLERIDGVPHVKAATPRIQFGTLIYGSPRLCITDIPDRGALTALLAGKGDRIAETIAEKLPADMKQAIRNDPADIAADDAAFIGLLDALNRIIQRYELYTPELLENRKISDELVRLISEQTAYRDRTLINRLVLEQTYPSLITESPRMGRTYTGLGYGVDFEREEEFFNVKKYLIEGTIPAPESDGLLLAFDFAKSMKLAVGDKLTIFTKTKYMASNAMTFRVSGIVMFPVSMFNTKLFLLPITLARELLMMGDSVTEILVLADSDSRTKSVTSQIDAILKNDGRTGLTASPWQSVSYIAGFLEMANIMYAIMALFFFALGTTVIINTTMMVIYERMREIGTIAAMGMTGGQIVRLFFFESFFISMVSAAAGVALGVAVMLPLNIMGLPMDSFMQGVTMEISSVVYPTLDPGMLVFVFVYAVVVSTLTSFIPSRRASRIEPVEALRAL